MIQRQNGLNIKNLLYNKNKNVLKRLLKYNGLCSLQINAQ